MNAIIELNDEETLAVAGGASIALSSTALGLEPVAVQPDALRRHGPRVTGADPTPPKLLLQAAPIAG